MRPFVPAALAVVISACPAVANTQVPDHTEAIGRIKAETRAVHPNDPRAQSKAINVELTSSVEKQTANPEQTATVMFLGYYMKHTIGLPEVCSEQGVTMVNYPKAFAAAHQVLADGTRKTLDTPGARDYLKAMAGPAARRELVSLSGVEKTDIKSVCLLIEKDWQGMVARMSFAKILPAQYQILLSSANAEELLLDRPDYRECEAETMTALSIARNAMHLQDSNQSMLSKSTAEFRKATASEVDEEIGRTGSKDHVGFAARKFFECTKRAKLPIKEDLNAATFCLARQDILFYLAIDREQGRPQGEADARIRKRFSNSSKSIYSDAIIDRLVPLVYQVIDNEDEYKLRRYMFEVCYLPDDWRVWDRRMRSQWENWFPGSAELVLR